MLKRVACLFLVVLMSIESFAAVVSDNDGAAFITKAEFDSMKNTFQQEIDRFNSQIDDKIDNAINEYLSGVKNVKVSYLESMLNKVNALADDFYLDAGGNKIKYGYRTMARRYAAPTTQKPVGARTAIFISRGDIASANTSGYARFAIDNATRTGLSLVNLPKDGNYKTGKFLMYDEIELNQIKYKYPRQFTSEYIYYYCLSGAARTVTAGNNPGQYCDYDVVGTFTQLDEFKNERTDWSLAEANVKWVWDNQEGNEAYSTIKCIYGTSFEKQDTTSQIPICGVLNQTPIGLSKTNETRMTLQETPLSWNLYTYFGAFWADGIEQKMDMWKGWDDGRQGTNVSINFNCHPYQTINLSDMVDYYSSSVLDKPVLLTDGVPVCKATVDGYVDIKMEFIGEAGHQIGFGIKKERLANMPGSYNIDANLRDFNDVKYSTRSSPNIAPAGSVQEMRLDVKKDDVIFIKCVDATYGSSSDYTLCGVRTQEIKQTSNG